MRKKILIVLAAIAAIVVVFAIVVALQPSEVRVERTATIAAPPPVVFAQVNDFHKWEAWSPWAKLDPAAKVTFEGAPAGQSAVFTWAGNDEVGEGRMTLMESRPSELIRIDVAFVKPSKEAAPRNSASSPTAIRPSSPGRRPATTTSSARRSASSSIRRKCSAAPWRKGWRR